MTALQRDPQFMEGPLRTRRAEPYQAVAEELRLKAQELLLGSKGFTRAGLKIVLDCCGL